VERDHREAARTRAGREFHVLATNTVRFLIWISLWTIAAGALGLALAWGHGRGATVLITTAFALAGVVVALALPFMWLWLTAAPVQREEARGELAERDELSRLIEMHVHLRRHRKANRRALEKVALEKRSGPLEPGADPWVRQLNDDLGPLVEGYLHPELAPRLTLQNPHLSSWEEVRQAAQRLDQKIGEVLHDQLFAEVYKLAEIDKDRRTEEAIDAIRVELGTELRDIRRKIEKVKGMEVQIYWEGFELPAARWHEYDEVLALEAELYAKVEAAYVAANDVNEAVRYRRSINRVPGRNIGANPTDGLDRAYEAAGYALDALVQLRGEPWRTPTQEAAQAIIEDAREELGIDADDPS
jgi:hypothetical protein